MITNDLVNKSKKQIKDKIQKKIIEDTNEDIYDDESQNKIK